MDKIVTEAEASRSLLDILKGVCAGEIYVVTVDGQPGARIIPIVKNDVAREKAWEALMRRLHSQPAINVGPWTREELYEDEPRSE
jgi:antitoxin (DNA-binding transcriptional repressor) of toxin-antitoxin stability system